MLTTTKQTALNLLLRFELYCNEALTEAQEAEAITSDEQYNAVSIIYRNIQSIKKQLKNL